MSNVNTINANGEWYPIEDETARDNITSLENKVTDLTNQITQLNSALTKLELQTVLVYGLNDGGEGSVNIASNASYVFETPIEEIKEVQNKKVIGISSFNTGSSYLVPSSYRISSDNKLFMSVTNIGTTTISANPRCYLMVYDE